MKPRLTASIGDLNMISLQRSPVPSRCLYAFAAYKYVTESFQTVYPLTFFLLITWVEPFNYDTANRCVLQISSSYRHFRWRSPLVDVWWPVLRSRQAGKLIGMAWAWIEPGKAKSLQIYIDASNPARSISARQARSIIRRLVAGFRAAGLDKGDTVCLHSFNDVVWPRFYFLKTSTNSRIIDLLFSYLPRRNCRRRNLVRYKPWLYAVRTFASYDVNEGKIHYHRTRTSWADFLGCQAEGYWKE